MNIRKRTALLVDGEWLRRRLDDALIGKLPHGVTADVMYRNVLLCTIPKEEDLFRIFYYDCPPYDGTDTNPIDGSKAEFKKQPKFRVRHRFLHELKSKDYVAMRLGVCKPRGWTLTDSYIKSTIKGQNHALKAADVFLSQEQKGVDMRIGMDVATLSLKRIVDRIVLISGDIDMEPALKLARREGIQVILVQVGVKLNMLLDENCDLTREIVPTP